MTRTRTAADVTLRAAFADELLERLANASARRAALRKVFSGGATVASLALVFVAGRRSGR